MIKYVKLSIYVRSIEVIFVARKLRTEKDKHVLN